MHRQSGSSKLLLMAFAAFIVISMSPSALGVAWLYIQRDFQLTLDGLGILLLATTLGRLVINLTSGRIIARIGTGILLFAGGIVMITGLSLYAISPTWGWLIAGAFIRGSGNAMIDSGLNTFVAEHYRTSRMNWLHACSGIGLTLGPLLITFVVGSLGQSWRFGYAVMIVPMVVITVMFLLTIKKWNVPPSVTTTAPEKINLGAPARDTLRLPVVWITMLAFFFYTGSEAGAGQVTSNLFTEGRAVDSQVVGYWITFYWASFTIGRFSFGMIIDRYDARMVLRMAIFGAAVGAGLLCLNLSNTVSFLGLALMGFTLAPVFPTLMSQTPSRVGLRHTANAIGFQGAAAGMGVSLLLALAGRLAETMGVEILDQFLLVVTIGTFLFHEMILYRESRRILLPMES